MLVNCLLILFTESVSLTSHSRDLSGILPWRILFPKISFRHYFHFPPFILKTIALRGRLRKYDNPASYSLSPLRDFCLQVDDKKLTYLRPL